MIISSAFSAYSDVRLNKKMMERMGDLLPLNRGFGYYTGMISNIAYGKDVRIYSQQALIKDVFRNSDYQEFDIEFKDVSFKYPKSDNYALKHISLNIKSGVKLAIVGVNSSGKTTLIKLICRLYDPLEGEILLNGINIKEFDYDSYCRMLSVVFQDFQLLAQAIGQNIVSSTV
ncbi:MAG TPA: hypothetical protein DD426_00195 [Clostridiaceae bacterium]|nr:hypothetical protein [Clostridiaceae bacterium]